MLKREYINGADVLRILSGFGVVLIHVTDPFLTYPPYFGVGGISWLFLNIVNAAFRVSVPLFIMLSGYLLLGSGRIDDFSSFYKKRFQRIAIPFFFWLAFYFIWQYFLGIPTSASSITNKLLSVDLSHLYFLIIILELYFITPLFSVFLKNTTPTANRVLIIASIIFTLLLSLINTYFPKARVLTQKNVLTIFFPYISYYLLGFSLRKVRFLSGKVYYAVVIFMALILFTALASNGVVNSYFRSYGSPNILLMCVIAFLLILHMKAKRKILQYKFVEKILKDASANIFGIFLVHMIVIEGGDRLFPQLKEGAISDPIWFYALIKVCIVFAISYVIVWSGRRIPYIKSLFG